MKSKEEALKTRKDNIIIIIIIRNIRLKRKAVIRLPSDRATSRPRALERSSDKKSGEREMGDGSGTNNGKHNNTIILEDTFWKSGMAN